MIKIQNKKEHHPMTKLAYKKIRNPMAKVCKKKKRNFDFDKTQTKYVKLKEGLLNLILKSNLSSNAKKSSNAKIKKVKQFVKAFCTLDTILKNLGESTRLRNRFRNQPTSAGKPKIRWSVFIEKDRRYWGGKKECFALFRRNYLLQSEEVTKEDINAAIYNIKEEINKVSLCGRR